MREDAGGSALPRSLRGQVGHLRVQLNKRSPLIGHIFFGKNGPNRTSVGAGFAVDTLIGVNVEHLLSLMKTVTGTNLDAFAMLATEAWLGNHMSHGELLRRHEDDGGRRDRQTPARGWAAPLDAFPFQMAPFSSPFDCGIPGGHEIGQFSKLAPDPLIPTPLQQTVAPQ